MQILTEGKDYLTARKYWNKLKQRLVSEDNETVTNCHQLKLSAADGKLRYFDVADLEHPQYETISRVTTAETGSGG